MTYFEQLQSKYPNDIKKAYKEYILSKTVYRTFYATEDATPFVKEAMGLQEKLNEYALSIINGPAKALMDILQKNQTEIIKYIEEKEELFDFLEIDRGSMINHMTGMYELKMSGSIPPNLKWEDLQSIIKEENNNIPVLEEQEARSRLKEISQKYGLNSITYGKIRVTKEAIDKLESSFYQLQQVIDCESQQVGLKKYSIFLDVSEFIYAGQACKINNEIKLYLNERLSHDAFAHEWLHGMDMLMANKKSNSNHMYSESGKGTITTLLKELNQSYIEDIIEIKKTVLEDTKSHIDKIINRFNLLAAVNNPNELKDKLQKEIKNIQEGQFNPETILEIVNSHMKEKNGCPSFILTEFSMLNKFLKDEDKNFKNSYFYEYAKEMQKSLEKTGFIEDEYSTLKEEMFARAFESFTQVKLKEKDLENNIAHANISAWTPKAIETIRQRALWEDVIKEMKEVMEMYLPQKTQLKNSIENTEYIKNNISKIRKTLNSSEEQKIAVKIK